MANIKTKFYVARGYYLRSRSLLGDSPVHGSIRDDSEAGKAECKKLREHYQEINNEDRQRGAEERLAGKKKGSKKL